MPINVHVSETIIPGWYNATNAEKETARELIDGDRFTYFEVFRRGSRTIVNKNGVRIDHQNDYDGADEHRHHNIQVQIGANTAAHADASESLLTKDPTNQIGVLHAVQRSLKGSLYDGHSRFITGSIP